VRDIRLIKVYSPTRENVEKYSHEISERLSCEVEPVSAPKDAVKGADIVATCTNAYTPVIKGEWLEPGTHVANVMSSELGPDVCARIDAAGLVVRRTAPSAAGFVDDDFGIYVNVMGYAAGQPDERAKIPTSSWEWQKIKARERYPNARYVDCVNWESRVSYRRSRESEITTLATQSFGTLEGDIGPSAGIQGIQFASIGGRIYDNARQKGLGKELPREMFLQDLPT
jgi:alanine dehydrogenase